MPDIKPNPALPDEEYEIEYIYGFRTFDCRQNLKYNAQGNLVTMAASCGIILDKDKNT